MTHFRAPFAVLPALALGLILAGTSLPAEASTHSPPSRVRHGQEAIDFLGDRLPAAAATLHQTPSALRSTLRKDPTLKVDASGSLLFVDQDPLESGQTTITDSVTTPPYATSQTFVLHSRPSATRKIYLDFNGHTTSGTKWNTQYAGGAAFTTGAFDKDGYPGSWSTAEHAAIQAVWLSVREDFAPFNVDVTTQDPGYDGLRYTYNGDPYYGVRVVVGRNAFYPASAGGVGYVGSFNYGNDTPVYVFTDSSVSSKFIAEASSHETGHAVGLSHDGNATQAYYPGQGNWAPIMGNSYSKAVTQWSRGEYYGANNTEDDLSIIASYTGWAADDVAAGTSTSATLPAATARYAAINWTGDVDTYRFSIGSTRTLSISTWHNTGPVDPDLNMRLTLRNAAGAVVATSSPLGDLRTAMTVRIPAGYYYASVDGVGEYSPASNGYSAYASQGYYGIELDWA
jgi:hypothetical protein